MTDTINNGIPFVPENTIDPAAGLNLSLNTIDALLQVLVQTVGANSPPGSPANGARYIVGAAPTGAWAGQTNKLARFLDGAWQFFDARYALNAADGLWYVRSASSWAPLAGGGATLPVVQALSSTRNLALADINTFNVNSTTNNYTATIPPQSSVTWTAGAEIHFLPDNTGDITITAAAGVSLNGVVAGSVTLSTQNGAASIKRIAADSWWVGGAIGLGVGSGNLLINGNFAINQRVYVSGAATTGANQYTLDRWRVVTSEQSLTFSASGNGNQVTAPAGGVEQVVENTNIAGGTYVLSWTGTATATVNGTARAKGEAFTLAANTNATVRFIGGTVSEAQLERGSIVSKFQDRGFAQELVLCKRYYQKSFNYSAAPAEGAYSGWLPGFSWSTTGLGVGLMLFPTRMRAAPTVTFYRAASSASPNGQWAWFSGTAYVAATTTVADGVPQDFGLSVTMTTSGAVFGQTYIVRGNWTASAEL